MRELSLFSGAGGGLLGTKLLGWEHIGYVEYNEYCQKVLKQRIKDGIINKAPIFGDIRAFISEGYADSYQGMVDVITAGFPCQDVSVANRRAAGMLGGRSGDGWKNTAECIRIIRPGKVLLENSPAILVRGFERVANDLASMGYSFRWGVLGADAVGADHHRARWWMVAYANSDRLQRLAKTGGSQQTSRTEQQRRETARAFVEKISGRNRSQTKPRIQRTVNDVANRVDRLKAIGNGQVPIMATAAWRLLNEN